MGEDIEQEEDQDPDRHGVERGSGAGQGLLDAADRQAQEDRGAGDRGEEQQLGGGHGGRTLLRPGLRAVTLGVLNAEQQAGQVRGAWDRAFSRRRQAAGR